MLDLYNFFHDPAKLLVILFLVFIWFFIFRTRRITKHQYNRLKSKAILQKVRSFPFDGQRIAYLRKIDPFVFEELLLDAFQAKGYKVLRNKRYTGDQGIDGIVWIDDKKYLIQAKRYTGHVNLQHVRDFATLVETHGCHGLFCHTGKTGKGSKMVFKTIYNIEVISGQKLVNLITEELTV